MQVVASPVLIPTVATPFAPPGKPSDAVSRTEAEATTFAPVDQTSETSAKRETQPSPSSADEQTRNRQQEIVQEQQLAQREADKQVQQQKAEQQQEKEQEQQDLALIRELAKRDREVRAHEQAHQAVGGRFAGAASYTTQRGPDGVAYAVGGEVPIDTSSVANNPEATIQKAQTVRRAALAPANPSAQDRAVAAQATQIELQARQDLAIQQREEAEVAEAGRQTATETEQAQTESTEEVAAAEETAQTSEVEEESGAQLATEGENEVAAGPAEEEQLSENTERESLTDLNRRNLSIYEEFVELNAVNNQSGQSPIDLTA